MTFYRLAPCIYKNGIKYEELTMIKETPKGYWLAYGNVSENFIKQALESKEPWRSFGFIWVSKTAKKRYAYPTKEEARESFIIRSRKYIQILKSRLENRKMLLKMAEDNNITSWPKNSFFDAFA